MKRSDTDIRRDLEAELQWDPNIDDRKIGVIVCDGIVTLTGEVTRLTGRWAAEDIAKRVSGVRAIANEIQVRLPLSGICSDTEIAEAAANALRWKVATAASSITPIVDRGYVTLSGEVMSGYQKQAAERSVQALLGVRHVTNDITVALNIKVADVKHRIEETLKRFALREATDSRGPSRRKMVLVFPAGALRSHRQNAAGCEKLPARHQLVGRFPHGSARPARTSES